MDCCRCSGDRAGNYERDEDGEGRGQGLVMLRLEARRYKREMQKIWMQRQRHEQEKATASLSSEDSSRLRDDRWRFSPTFTPSPATSVTPMFWNREDAPVSRMEQLAIVEEGTQTETPSKSEVQTETEKLQFDDDVMSSLRESRTISSAVNNISSPKTCSRHCDELRSRISQDAACECLADAAVRVNADVVFTAKPKRVIVAGQVETPDINYTRALRPVEMGQISSIATSPTGSLNKGQKSTGLVEDARTGLRSLASPVPQHDSACSPIHNLHEYEVRFKRLGDICEGTKPVEMFPWHQGRSAPEGSSSIAPPAFSTRISPPQPEASWGGIKAEDNVSDLSSERSKRKRIRDDPTGESAIAARLAAKIKHALEEISGKTATRPTISTFDVSGRAMQSTSTCKLHFKDEFTDMKLVQVVGDRTLNDKEQASSDSSFPEARQHARKAPLSFSQHHNSNTPCSDADMYSQNIMAALSADRYTSNKLPGSGVAREVSPERATKGDERRSEESRRADVKSCGDHHASHQVDGIKTSGKTNVRHSGSKHLVDKDRLLSNVDKDRLLSDVEKQRLLSNVEKLQNVAETAKRLYADIVDCAYDGLRASTGCGNLVKHQDEDGARAVSKFDRSSFCPSTEIISAHRADVAASGNDEVCGRCHVCQPQFGSEQPCEEAQTDSPDEITIELSDNSPTNIKLSRNYSSQRPGLNVEVSAPCELPSQRTCSPQNRGGSTVRQGVASWKNSLSSPTRRTGPAGRVGVHQPKQGRNECLLDHRRNGPRDNCRMPTYGKGSRASTVRIGSPKSYFNKCLLDRRCDGPRNSCHMPTARCASPRNSRRGKCSGDTQVCISPPKKDPTLCCLDPRCVGSRDMCHMPTYAKNSRASCGPGGSFRKRDNGTILGNVDPSGLFRCPFHRDRGMAPVKGKVESKPCPGRHQSVGTNHTDAPHDMNLDQTFSYERKQNSPARRCRNMSRSPDSSLKGFSNVGIRSEASDRKNGSIMHKNGRISLVEGKGIEFCNGGHEETARLRHSSNERMDRNNPLENFHASLQECTRAGVIRNRTTATEDFEKEPTFVGKESRQPTKARNLGNASAVSEAYTQTIQQHHVQSENVDRSVAAAGLAKEIEVMIADQLGKSNRRFRESNVLSSQRRFLEEHKDSFGQTKLDVAVRAAANAVKKLKPVSLLPTVKHDEGNLKATPRKGPTPRAKSAGDAIGNSFYDQMYKELEDLSLERMQLVRHERAKFRSELLSFPCQHPSQEQERRGVPSIKLKMSSDLKNLVNSGGGLEECRRSLRTPRSQEFTSLRDVPMGSHTPGSKRQRSATSPAREQSNKLLRLNIGKVDSKAGRKKQEQHSTLPPSINQALRKSNHGLDRVRLLHLSSGFPRRKSRTITERDIEKSSYLLKSRTMTERDIEKSSDFSSAPFGLALANRLSATSLGSWKPLPKETQAKTTTKKKTFTARRKGRTISERDIEKLSDPSSVPFGLAMANRLSATSLGRWKPAPGETQAKTTTKRKAYTTRNIRPPPWVERMSKAKSVFSSLLRPLLLAHYKATKEPQVRATVRKRPSRPPGLTFKPSMLFKQLGGKRIPGGGTFSLMEPNTPKKHSKKLTAPNLYDVRTGRKIVPSEQEPGEILRKSVETQYVRPNFKSLHEKKSRITRRSLVKQVTKPSAGAKSNEDYLSIRGWNSDPSIKSDHPHKPADIIRHNRNGGLDVRIHRRDAVGKPKPPASTSVRKLNMRHVTFAGMVVQNSRLEKNRTSSVAPQNIDSPKTPAACNKTSISKPSRVKRTPRGKRRTSATNIQPMQGKLHRYGGGGEKWIYHEGFWQEIFSPELDKESQGDSFQSLMAPGPISQPDTPLLEFKTAQAIETITLHSNAQIAVEDSSTIEPSLMVKATAAEEVTGIADEKNSVENANNIERRNESAVQRSEGGWMFQNPDLSKSLGFFNSDDLKGGAVIDYRNIQVARASLTPSRSTEEAGSCSETKSTTISEWQALGNIIACPDHADPERREPILISKEFPQSSVRLLDEVFPDISRNDAPVSMVGRVQRETSVHFGACSEIRRSTSECTTRPTFPREHGHEHEGHLRKLELERTLMDIALQTILRDDPLHVQETHKEPITLPINRRMVLRADKEVEALVHSHDMSQSPLSKILHDMSQSPLSKLLPCVDKSTEHDLTPLVDRATELDVVPYVDRATELDYSSLLSKDQDSQTMDTELRIPDNQRLTSPTQENCGEKLQSTQVHHQATDCRVPWNSLDIPPILAASPSPPAAMPMLMPVFFQQFGTSMLPMMIPSFNFELPGRIATSSNLQPSPVSAVSSRFPAGVDQGTQATESHNKSNSKEVAAQVSKLATSSRADLEQIGTWEEESDSDWDDTKRGSSPSTPSTPLSSPDHKKSLRKAMQLYSKETGMQETIAPRNDPQAFVPEVCKPDGLRPIETLVEDAAPPIQMVTEIFTEETTAEKPILIANATRRGTSWAKVKEMEEAALSLLRAASMKTPSATSPSECSRESSPEVMSPGEVHFEGHKDSIGGRKSCSSSAEHLGKLPQSQSRSWFSFERTSLGEVYNPVCFLGPLSEGEIEFGAVPSPGESGQIQNGFNVASHSTTDLQGQGSEPGEAVAPSPQSSPTHQSSR